jgi:peptidoglycan/LPS O-acetylase OafA/YrhL
MRHPAQRNQALDILRAFAVLLVLGRHVPYYQIWTRVGWIGVDLFFVLSGFLISSLLFREFQQTGSIAYSRFIIRRGLKIWPSFYVLLLVALVIVTIGNSWFHTWPDGFPYLRFVAHTFFLQSYGYHTVFYLRPLEHTWSLAVEEHFYLLFPLLLIALSRFMPKKREVLWPIPYIFLALFFACLVLRMFSPVPGSQVIVAATHLRLDSLFSGVAIGYLAHFRKTWFARIANLPMLIVAAVLCAPSFFFESKSRWMQVYGVSGLLLAFAIVVACSADKDFSKILGTKVSAGLSRIGRDSYAIYLWHYPLALFFSFIQKSAAVFWLYMMCSIALGVLMAKAVEQPFLRLRDKLFPSASSASLVVGPEIDVAPNDQFGPLAMAGLQDAMGPGNRTHDTDAQKPMTRSLQVSKIE